MKKVTVVALIVSALVVITAQTFAQATDNSGMFYFGSLVKSAGIDDNKAELLKQDARVSEPAVAFSFEASSRWSSKYVSPFDKLCYDGPVIQSDITAWMKCKDFPGKFYFSLWHSYSFKGLDTNAGDELDFTLGWKGEIYKKVNLNLWATYFDFIPLEKFPGNKDQIRFYAELDRKFEFKTKPLFGDCETTSSVTPFLRFEVPYGLQYSKDRSGLRVYPGLKCNWEFAKDWSVSQKLNLCLDDGAMGFKPETFLDYKVGLSWQAKKWLTLEPISFRVITPLGNVDDGRKTNTIIGFGGVIRF